MIAATGALQRGADATDVVCLVRQVINGKHGKDISAIWKGDGCPSTNFNATKTLVKIFDKTKVEAETFTHEQFEQGILEKTIPACDCKKRVEEKREKYFMQVPIRGGQEGVCESIGRITGKSTARKKCLNCPRRDGKRESVNIERKCIQAPDVMIMEVVEECGSNYKLEDALQFEEVPSKVLELKVIVLYNKHGVGHYQAVRKVGQQWFMFDDISEHRTAQVCHGTSESGTPTLEDIAAMTECAGFKLESLVYIHGRKTKKRARHKGTEAAGSRNGGQAGDSPPLKGKRVQGDEASTKQTEPRALGAAAVGDQREVSTETEEQSGNGIKGKWGAAAVSELGVAAMDAREDFPVLHGTQVAGGEEEATGWQIGNGEDGDFGTVVVVSEDHGTIAAANENMGLAAAVSGGDVGAGATGSEDLGTTTAANGDTGRAAAVSGDLGTVAVASKDLGAAAVRSGDLEDWKMGNVETEKSRTEVGVTDRAEEDGKMGGASSGLRIARIVGTPEVAATAQQGVVTSLAHSDRRVAAVARMEEGAEGTAEVAATAQQGAVTPVAHSNGRAAAEGSEGWQMGNAGAEAAAAAAGGAAGDGSGAAAEAAAGTAAGVRPPRPANWGSMSKNQKLNWRRRNERKQIGMGV